MSRTLDLNSLPEHPLVDWSKIYYVLDSTAPKLDVVCRTCNKVTPYFVRTLVGNVKRGNYTGKCKVCASVGRNLHKWTEIYAHPAVHWGCTKGVIKFRSTTGRALKARTLTHVKVVCLDCGKEQWQLATFIAQRIREGTYTGKCKVCALLTPEDSPNYLSEGRSETFFGYVHLDIRAISPEDLPLFKAMKGKKKTMFEHRFVMAKHLGRPLRDNELVDHMDGNKQNNDISNLRIYIKGKNQPGSHNGNGTYYHEWQAALARVSELENELALLRNNIDTTSKQDAVMFVN